MNEQSRSEHLSEDQLLEAIYGLETANTHLRACVDCSARLSAMRTARRTVENAYLAAHELPSALLAQQRRQILAQVDRKIPAFGLFGPVGRWASALGAIVLLGSGIALFEAEQHSAAIEDPGQVASAQLANVKVTDAELAEDVSQVAGTPEPTATAPLQALFEE